MFGGAYFGKAYWGGTYWGPAGGVVPPQPPVQEQQPTGGWENSIYWRQQQSADDIRKERERLGILPRQRKIITRAARKIEDLVPVSLDPEGLRVEIQATDEFAAMLSALAIKDAERRAAISAFAADMITQQILMAIEAEEESRIIELLLIEM